MDPITTNLPLNGLDRRMDTTAGGDLSPVDQSLFIQLLGGILSAGENPGTANSLAGGGLMTPLLMTLVEQLLADQLHSQGASGMDLQSLGFSAAYQELGSSFPGDSPQGAPVHGPLTQNFHPGHNGLDFGVVVGTPAQATMTGKVVYAGWNNEGYGNLVVIENGPYKTYFAHLSDIPVQVGQTVAAGETIGLTGNSGHSTGPHLHYEVRRDGKPIDPTTFTLG